MGMKTRSLFPASIILIQKFCQMFLGRRHVESGFEISMSLPNQYQTESDMFVTCFYIEKERDEKGFENPLSLSNQYHTDSDLLKYVSRSATRREWGWNLYVYSISTKLNQTCSQPVSTSMTRREWFWYPDISAQPVLNWFSHVRNLFMHRQLVEHGFEIPICPRICK